MTPNSSFSLLMLKDTLDRYPDARQALLQSEIAHHEREIVLLRSHRTLMHMQLWSAFQTALIAGFVVFSLGIAFLGFVQLAKTVERAETWNTTLSSSVVARGLHLDFKSLLPDSPWFDKAAVLPTLSVKQTTTAALVVALTFLIFRILQGLNTWRDSRQLKTGIHLCEDELKVLRSWLREPQR